MMCLKSVTRGRDESTSSSLIASKKHYSRVQVTRQAAIAAKKSIPRCRRCCIPFRHARDTFGCQRERERKKKSPTFRTNNLAACVVVACSTPFRFAKEPCPQPPAHTIQPIQKHPLSIHRSCVPLPDSQQQRQ